MINITKNFDFYIILNAKTGRPKINTRKPKRLSPFELLISAHIDMEIPKTQEFKINGKITLSETKMNEIFLEAVEEEK